ncbi:TetR/AcrR family transcriptional regulator [Leifsonia sp. RAF41]|uniref:TetR/AcrR family transcriptional regulator n=1 Tax=Leifsonia sp. RAF41 TaxID=3233056 RepID=UPI003F95C8E0
MKTSRQYVMQTRAEQTERTRQRILDATLGLALERPLVSIALPDVAERASTSVQTILRQFGSRDALFDAAQSFAEREVLAERETVPGEVTHALETIVDHYELRGDGVLLLLGQESWEPRAAAITASGRTLHRSWVENAFGPLLPGADTGERDTLIDLLVVATDVFTWKLLRRDRGLSAEETAHRMHRLVAAVLERN